MSYYYSPIGILVECKDCKWKTQSYKNGQAIAKIHAEKYHHKVHGELTVAFCYDFREKKTEKARLDEKWVKKKYGYAESSTWFVSFGTSITGRKFQQNGRY
jgi:hypothetical protein